MSSSADWTLTLRAQIESLARRHQELVRRHSAENGEIGDTPLDREAEMIVALRDLVRSQPDEAAKFFLEVAAVLDENERKLAPSKVITISSPEITPPRELQISKVMVMEKQPEEKRRSIADEMADYMEYRSKWWRVLCLNSGKEAEQRLAADVRDLWKTQLVFFLSCLGFIVGVGNVFRFPSKVYANGGGTFFIPYTVCLVLFGLPIVFMHLAIGQYSGLSASGAFWKLMPIASGIGWALVLLAVPVAIYYNMLVAWSTYYLWQAIGGLALGNPLPWDNCRPEWTRVAANNRSRHCCELHDLVCFNSTGAISSTEAYFHYEVLNETSIFAGNFSLGEMQGHLVLALAIAWLFVFIGVCRGIGSIGSVVAITSTLPYLLLFVLLLRAVSMPGAGDGLAYLFTVDGAKLWSLQIWRDAAEQVFYELGIDAGPLISMASFSRFRNNIYRDALLLVLIDALTSLACGVFMFSVIGFLAFAEERPIADILCHDSLYVAFTVLPGLSRFLARGALWVALFFAMLLVFALDAEFAWLEMLASSLLYQFGWRDKHVENRILAVLCIAGFCCGLPLCAQGGIYLFHSIENLNANWNSFSVSLLQIVLVCFAYGVDRIQEDIGDMLRVPKLDEPRLLGARISIRRRIRHAVGPTGAYIRWSWCLLCPAVLTALCLTSAFSYHRVRFDDRPVPLVYESVGWVAMVGPLLVVPFTALYALYDARRRNKPLSTVFSTAEWRGAKRRENEAQPKHPGRQIATPQAIAGAEGYYAELLDADDYEPPVQRGLSARRPIRMVRVTVASSMYGERRRRIAAQATQNEFDTRGMNDEWMQTAVDKSAIGGSSTEPTTEQQSSSRRIDFVTEQQQISSSSSVAASTPARATAAMLIQPAPIVDTSRNVLMSPFPFSAPGKQLSGESGGGRNAFELSDAATIRLAKNSKSRKWSEQPLPSTALFRLAYSPTSSSLPRPTSFSTVSAAAAYDFKPDRYSISNDEDDDGDDEYADSSGVSDLRKNLSGEEYSDQRKQQRQRVYSASSVATAPPVVGRRPPPRRAPPLAPIGSHQGSSSSSKRRRSTRTYSDALQAALRARRAQLNALHEDAHLEHQGTVVAKKPPILMTNQVAAAVTTSSSSSQRESSSRLKRPTPIVAPLEKAKNVEESAM